MNMRKLFYTALFVLCLTACGRKYYIKDYESRLAAYDGALAGFMALPDSLSGAERDALAFLYAYMPLADVTDYPQAYYLENVRAALRMRDRWGVPEREWRHFVLPVRVNNENLDGHRAVFQAELLPRIDGLSMQEAILEVNHWCHEKVTYQPSDARTSSPLNTVKNALGRCGEESTFTVAALRSVGIPARQVYTPRWAHTDDNHAWVEAWADGRWWFLGACEPEPVLNLGWFNAPASRAMLMHTRVFGRYDGPEEVVLAGPNYTEINLIDNYAGTARADFSIVRPDGTPASGARVDFCIYNYAEFYPAVTKYADSDGRTFIKAGLGDLLVWASLDGAYGYRKVRFGEDDNVQIVLDNPTGRDAFTVTPPPERTVLPEVTPEQRARNDRRFAREDSLRQAYEATFPTMAEALAFVRGQGYGHHMAYPIVKARGNWETIESFMAACGNQERIEEVLTSLSTKDLHDVTLEQLQDYYSARPFRGSRIENEFLSPWYSYLQGQAPEATPDSVRLYDEPAAWRIPMSPEGVWRTRLADSRSLQIFTVACLRARGEEARLDPVTGKLKTAAVEKAPQGTLNLAYRPAGVIEKPAYYSHFTLSRMEDGRPHLLSFDEEEQVPLEGLSLDAGDYLLVSGNRLSDGSVPVSMVFFTLSEGAEKTVELVLEEGSQAVPVMGSFDAEQKILVDGAPVSILSQTGRGFYALALLDPGKEPTNHILQDLSAAREQLEAWGRPIVLLCPSAGAEQQLRQDLSAGRYGTLPATVQVATAPARLQEAVAGARPVVLLCDSFNRLFFRSEGYTIGLGARLAETAAKL